MLKPTHLRCEYLVDPVGIDADRPRLFWRVESRARDQRQTAYEILAASSLDRLEADEGDLWSTGKVASSRTIHVPYAGKALSSGQQVFWKVRVWDGGDVASSWSQTATFTMGLLEPGDWQARWIGWDGPTTDPVSMEGSRWIWTEEPEPLHPTFENKVRRFFRGRVELPAEAMIRSARLYIAATGDWRVFVNGERVAIRMPGAQPGQSSTNMQKVGLNGFLEPGSNVVAIEVGVHTPGPLGMLGKIVVDLVDGRYIVTPIDGRWLAQAEHEEGWTRTRHGDKHWSPALEVGLAGDAPWGAIEVHGRNHQPPPYFRRTFAVGQPVRRATLYATALGVFEAELNGRRVGEEYFAPGWTDYHKRLYYFSYDVTGAVREGVNCLGLRTGYGWYAGKVGWLYGALYGERIRVRAQLAIEYEDGTTETIGTDGEWRAAEGGVREADLQMGEVFDGRLEPRNWSRGSFNDESWAPVVVEDGPDPQLQAYPGVPVRRIEELPARSVKKSGPDRYIFDLGQNMVGFVRLRVSGEAGTRVILRFAEMLTDDGRLYLDNLRGARAVDVYTLAGGQAEEVWEPRFTFHGFRYVELAGLAGKPPLESVTGVVLASDVPAAGRFECSNEMVNQLHSNILWGQRGNYLEVPTDCPQRDERLGWTGDAQAFIRTATYLADIGAFYKKWLVDLEDAQRPDGAFTDVAPHLGCGPLWGHPGWADAGVICPYMIWKAYDDTTVIERHWKAMKRWIDCMRKTSDKLIRPDIGYGDWLSVNAETPRPLIGTAYFAWCCRLMAEMGRAIGKRSEATKLDKLGDEVRERFNEAFVKSNGKVGSGSQTSYVLALWFDLLSEKRREKAAARLVQDLEDRGGLLSVGFIGISYLVPTLTSIGRLDLAYRLLQEDRYPSWGFEIRNGATTIWERWNSWTPEEGFGDVRMNSFNHYAFGSIGEWMYHTLAGIDTEGPGFREIVIRPRPGGGMSYARAAYDSIHGLIRSEWALEGGEIALDVEIPANTTATVHVPTDAPDLVTEGGKAAESANGVKALGHRDGAAVFRVGSGVYRFAAPAAE